MGQRIYVASFNSVAVSAVQDLISLRAGAANGIELHHAVFTAGNVTSPAEINLRLKRLPATVTAGSGGSALTPLAIDSGDTRATAVTARANDTTQATTSGTAAIIAPWWWNVLGQFEHLPAPEDREVVQAGEALVFEVAAAPGASTTISGFIKYRELP